MSIERNVLALSGGVGGAKLALGLAGILPETALQVLVNTGDDFQHLGLHISPDIDTLLYTLSGRSNVAQGWGIEGESWTVLEALKALDGETWFALGDKDLATHLWRTARLAAGDSLSQVTNELAQRLGVPASVLPMCDEPVRSTVQCGDRDLGFQEYFVKEQCSPVVSGFHFEGIEKAALNPHVLQRLQRNHYSAIVVCPSNPFVSIDPILSVPGCWEALRDSTAPVALVSPIVAGQALKGPAAKMMRELQVPVTALGVAQHYVRKYPGLVDCFVIDESDATLSSSIEALDLEVAVTRTVMKTLQDKQQLADDVLRALGQ